MDDIEDIGDHGEVRDDTKFKKGKVTNRRHQPEFENVIFGKF